MNRIIMTILLLTFVVDIFSQLAFSESKYVHIGANNSHQSIFKSDVDINIPKGKIIRDNTFVIIWGNEFYSNFQTNSFSDIDFAINDAFIFKRYCLRTLNIPE